MDELLEQYRGQTVFYKPNPGNGGDALIAYSAFVLLKKFQMQVRIVRPEDDLTNQVVFYCGGGNLVNYYHHCAEFMKQVHQKVKHFILLPHTIDGHKELLTELGENVTLICREQKSFNYVNSFSNIGQVLLADDLVFNMDVTSDFPELPSAKSLAKVMTLRPMLAAVYRKRQTVGYFTKKRVTSKSLHAFRDDVERTTENLGKENIDVTALINLNPAMDSFELVRETTHRILRFLNQFSEINTNRLHVAIAGALLGKQVNFYGNAYHKNESVYHYSMQGKYPTVNWKGNQTPQSAE